MRKKYAIEDVEKYRGATLTKRQKARIARSLIWSKIVYHFEPDEFFCYHLEDASWKEKKKYISDYDNEKFTSRMNRSPQKRKVLSDKYETYKLFKKFYSRDVCMCVCNESGKNNLLEFTNKHTRFIAKPLDGSCGAGIEIYDLTDYDSFDDMYSDMLGKFHKSFIAEELVVQTEDLAKFNPTSVNTIRIPTYCFDDRIEIRHPLIRIGQGGNIVDNAGAGGIFALIDENTGIIISAAVDEKGKNYLTHPDTGVQIIGYKIPHWEEVKAFAIDLAKVIPENRYVGWDVALTDKGCVMIEGNSNAQFIHQFALQKGFKSELNEIMREMGIKC